MSALVLPVGESPWRRSDRFDPRAVAIADRHYNRQKPGTNQFMPPGRCLVLLAADRSALWGTSWPRYAQHAWSGAWVNTVFRREGGEHLASDLIRWAVAHTRAKWPHVPDLGMVTFIDPSKTKPKGHPGYCYRQAGFEVVGTTKSGLVALQLRPEFLPLAMTIPFDQVDLFTGEAA